MVADTVEMTFSGTLEGFIALKPEGNNGFGYDPIFYVPEYGATLAQLDSETKNKISHRGRAFKLLTEKLKSWDIK